MTDRTAVPDDNDSVHIRELLSTTRGVPLIRVVRHHRARLPTSRSGTEMYMLTVPVDLEALLARLLEAREANRAPPMARRSVRFAGWELDLIEHRLIAPGGGVARLPGLEFGLLKAFVGRPRRLLTRAELAKLTKRDGKAKLSTRTVDSYVSRLRRRLRDGGAASIIATVPNVGYSFDADVVCA